MMDEKLPGIAAVRMRPGMFVGDTDGSGVLHLLLEVLANSFDQYLAGRCSRVEIEIAADGTITISDDGPGLAADGGDGLPPLHEILTRMSDRPTIDGHRPHAHLGLGGIGLFVVNALSERFEVHSIRGGTLITAAYSRGEVVEPVKTVSSQEPRGTRIRFRPDPAIFPYPRVPRVELALQLEDLSFLAPRFAISWTIDGDDTAGGGVAARVALGVPCELAHVATHAGTYETAKGPIDVEVALSWRRSAWSVNSEPVIESFVNLGRTERHGSHVEGLLDGIRAFFGGRKEKRLGGMVAAVSVVLADVKYGEPDKSRLESREAHDPVEAATRTALTEWERARPELVAEIRTRMSGA